MWGFREKIFTKLGFTDSYNLGKKWYSREYIGVDQGISILMIENFLRGSVWERFMDVPQIERWVDLAQLRPESKQVSFSPESQE